MCGIAGIYSFTDARLGQTVAAMTETLHHRGPDGHGYIALQAGQKRLAPASNQAENVAGRLFFGHRRLSIVDLDGSAQPLSNEDGSIWVVFNGEIYNYQDLRRDLIARGHTFKEAGDSEVLVHLWEEYQEKMLERLVGMFSIALFDTNRNTLFLSRDRYGQKPLYYWQTKSTIAFASELQALRKIPGFPKQQIDQVAAAQYFRYGYIPSPRTIYQNCRSLPAGHFLLQQQDHSQIVQYWQPRVSGDSKPITLDELQQEFDEAVRLRLMADVPLGAFLSGGIDSTLIVASMSRQLKDPVTTFTINSGNSWFDESEAATMASNHLGCNHYEEAVKPDLVAVSQRLASHYGQPFADFSSVPTYYVSRAARRRVKVALSGDGGDELFAGYERYTNSRWTKILANVPSIIRQSGAAMSHRIPGLPPGLGGRVADFLLSAGSVVQKGENLSSTFHETWRKSAFTPELLQVSQHNPDVEHFATLFSQATSRNEIERWLEVDQRMYLSDAMLVKVDIASMAASLECRSPMLDHRFAELANRLPMSAKLTQGQSKTALRQLNARYLPATIANAPKKGFSLPLGEWMRGDLKEWSHDMIFDRPSWQPFLRQEAVRQLWLEHQTKKWDHTQRLWSIVAWNLWAQAWD
ncbi:MAG: asparagine synthase (glutamine-hydrolyzing) [Magnetococcales bacterium]|nr:asparagine synthase (glutamine-hydrolyzing) [Magnetococcales bacterium]